MSPSSHHLRSDDELAPRDSIVGYDLLTTLGGDAFATTYRAVRLVDERVVALKVLTGATEAPARRALNRYWLASQQFAGDPHTLDVLDTGTTRSDRPFLVTRLCELGSLGGRVAMAGTLPVGLVLAGAVRIALAAHTAHVFDVFHRDIKPNNILLDADERPVLAEFVSAGLRADRTPPAGPYVAPELLAGARPSSLSDVYALAATMVHLLAGAPPNSDDPAVARRWLVDTIGRASADLPPRLWQCLRRGVAAAPGNRHRDAAALAQDLQQIMAELSLPVSYAPTIAAEPVPSLANVETATAPGTCTAPAEADALPRVPRERAGTVTATRGTPRRRSGRRRRLLVPTVLAAAVRQGLVS